MMIDASHANGSQQFKGQMLAVGDRLVSCVPAARRQFGVMVESHLVEGASGSGGRVRAHLRPGAYHRHTGKQADTEVLPAQPGGRIRVARSAPSEPKAPRWRDNKKVRRGFPGSRLIFRKV